MADPFEQLRRNCVGEEFDYVFLLSQLQNYAKPRDKITRYLKNGDIIRVKKGLYVFGDRWRKNLISLEVLANLVYGPSYLSLEYALSFYGLIPEKVMSLTSVTTQKNKFFGTPIGLFSYQHVSANKYQIGIRQQAIDLHRYFLIASKEKALADLVARQSPLLNLKELKEFLFDDKRIDPLVFYRFNRSHLAAITRVYQHPSVTLLNQLIQEKL